MKFISVSSLIFFTLCVSVIPAQQDHVTGISSEKVSSIDALLSTVYAVISGNVGEERNWDEFRALFIRDARLTAVHKDRSGKIVTRRMSPDDFITNANPYFIKNGFLEKGIHSVTERFGNIAHVFSTYESRNRTGDAEPFARGINSFQLMYDGNRWWVVSIYWQDETPDNPIPDKYLN